MNTIHISLGSDCAVAYNLRKLNLVSEAYPFDWIKCDKPSMICDCIDNEFSIFFPRNDLAKKAVLGKKSIEDDSLSETIFFDNITQLKQSDNFMNFDENIISKIKLKLSNNIILPHEAIGDKFDFDKYKEKYVRRIDRFNKIVRDFNIKKIFVRADNKKIKEEEKKNLLKSLDNYGCVNYDLIFIDYSQYPVVGEFNWKREYMDWAKIFL
jgi:calcineurin-like phosphoesterase family protein